MVDSHCIKITTPKTRNRIRKDAFMLRKRFGLEKVMYFQIMPFLEFVMPQIDPEFYVHPVPDNELIGRAAETIPEAHCIVVKESVYNGACIGQIWARSIMAHELGHYLYHSSSNVAYAYPERGERVPNEVNPEKQADIFAAELLAPVNLIHDQSEYLVSKHCGIPRSIARIQMGQALAVERQREKRHRKRNPQKEKRSGSLPNR